MTPRKFASVKQRRYLGDLARRAGVVPPRVIYAAEASDAIRRLENHIAHLRQPQLGAM